MLTQKGDFKMKNRINLSKYILSCAKNDFLKNAFFFVDFINQKDRRKEMTKYIAEKYNENLKLK